MDDIIIRAANIDDAYDICSICKFSLGYKCSSDLIRHRLQNADPSQMIVLVAEYNGNAIGFVHAEKYECLYFENALNILGLAVLKEYQRNGIGTMLMNGIEKRAAESGIRFIRVNSGSSRLGAHKFYRKNGYDNEKEQIRFLKQI